MNLHAIPNSNVFHVSGVPANANSNRVAASISRFLEAEGWAMKKHNATRAIVRVRRGKKDRTRFYALITLT